MTDNKEIMQQVFNMVPQPPPFLPDAEVKEFVSHHFRKSEKCLKLWEEHGRIPLYLLDSSALKNKAETFKTEFSQRLPEVGCYYAMKSNNCPEIAGILLQCGFGLDVSSGRELQTALDLQAQDIVFSGPAKTDRELKSAVAHPERVVILMDSFGELERLGKIAASGSAEIRVGVRLTPPLVDSWRKFGIPLNRLREFWQQAAAIPNLKLTGIQFHTSWNMDPSRQIETIKALGAEIAGWPESMSREIRFIDIGGGIWPPRGEWLQSSAIPQGQARALLENYKPEWNVHYKVSAKPLTYFAGKLSEAVNEYIFPTVRCRICLEPGRWICSEALHLIMSVIDKKFDDLVITDAATNAVGWERFEHYYAPILNLSQPELKENKCQVLGSLCTPEDTWGYSFWGKGISNNDVLLIPDQGSYTFSLKQEFIKPLPKLVEFI